jgi:hypothetical protein
MMGSSEPNSLDNLFSMVQEKIIHIWIPAEVQSLIRKVVGQVAAGKRDAESGSNQILAILFVWGEGNSEQRDRFVDELRKGARGDGGQPRS